MRNETEKAEKLARFFHDTYEKLAPSYGYKTREASRKPWSDVPEDNKALMIAVAGEVRKHLDLEDMEEDVAMLRALEAAGVDNWEGYDNAREILREWESE